MNRPRAMGGAGGMSDEEAATNGSILKYTVGTATFAALWAEYGFLKASEMVLSAFLNYGTICDGIDNTDRGRSGRGRGAVTRESLEKENRKTPPRRWKIKWK